MNKTHGCSRFPGYGSYKQMIRRCTQKSHKDFPRYGGSGIIIHPDWLNNPASFFEEIGPSPGVGYQIDRINSTEGYVPGNVRWATSKTNNQNRRNNRLLLHQGCIRTASAWEQALDYPRCIITKRLNRGWTASQALATPASHGSGRSAIKIEAKAPVIECSYYVMQDLKVLTGGGIPPRSPVVTVKSSFTQSS